MEVSQFRETLDKLEATNSRNEKETIIADVSDTPAAISFLSGSEFESAGLGKKTVHGVAEEVFGSFEAKPTVSEALEQFDDSSGVPSLELSILRRDMEQLAELSGNEMKEHLAGMFKSYSYPSVVSHACLDDLPTGVGDSTIADAMDVRDSLPFYEGVHEIAAEAEPLTEPKVGSAFSPMLAVPESRGEPANPVAQLKVDGYRAIVHISGHPSDQEVRVFSRRMNDITESLPEIQEVDWPAGSFILDGEIIASDGSYSTTSSRIGRKRENIDDDTEMQFACFDAIIYAGERVWTEEYAKRYTRLESMDINTSDTFQLLPIETEIEEAKDRAADHGEEGIIVKDWESPYIFDKRSAYWQKRKLDAETVDLKVAGFEEGEGKASGTLGKVELETSDGIYVGNSGSGFSDEERDTIWNNQDEWLGRCIEVEARGIGTGDKLRMPIFVRDRSDDGTADSWERVQEVMQDV